MPHSWIINEIPVSVKLEREQKKRLSALLRDSLFHLKDPNVLVGKDSFFEFFFEHFSHGEI